MPRIIRPTATHPKTIHPQRPHTADRLSPFSVRLARMVAPGFLSLVLGLASTAAHAEPGALVDLRCERAGGPVDLAECLPDSRLEVGREGVITAYRAEDLHALGAPTDGTLSLSLPFNFRVMAQNTGADTRLFLRIATPSGRTVHTAEAERYEWVQFTHCGPQIDPTCRDYNFSPDGGGGKVRPTVR